MKKDNQKAYDAMKVTLDFRLEKMPRAMNHNVYELIR